MRILLMMPFLSYRRATNPKSHRIALVLYQTELKVDADSDTTEPHEQQATEPSAALNGSNPVREQSE
jgi:hypothetical protein